MKGKNARVLARERERERERDVRTYRGSKSASLSTSFFQSLRCTHTIDRGLKKSTETFSSLVRPRLAPPSCVSNSNSKGNVLPLSQKKARARPRVKKKPLVSLTAAFPKFDGIHTTRCSQYGRGHRRACEIRHNSVGNYSVGILKGVLEPSVARSKLANAFSNAQSAIYIYIYIYIRRAGLFQSEKNTIPYELSATRDRSLLKNLGGVALSRKAFPETEFRRVMRLACRLRRRVQ